MFLPKNLDFVFPFIVFGYGLIMVLIGNLPFFKRLGETSFSNELWQQFQSHRIIGLFCFVLGFFWSLQNLITPT